MLNKLKNLAGGNAVNSVVEKICPSLSEQLNKVTELKPEQVKDDATFTSMVVKPALTLISASSGGVTKLIPNFNDKVSKALFNVRDELIEVNDGKVSLVDGFQAKLPTALLDGLKA